MDVLIDLDGTLVDPAAGIIASFQLGLRAVGATVLDARALHWIIGPPLRQSYALAGVAPEAVEDALAAYRVNYRAGAMFDATPYAGISDALACLRGHDHRLIVATSKPHVFARQILEKFELAQYFSAIHGSELDGRRDDKGELIAYIIATERVQPTRAVMIGDRKFDCVGGNKNALRCLGVAWGYGSREELVEAGALAIVERTDLLADAVTALA
jgi:phosphoglycolate phosphatase